jgi:Cytochrome P460
MTAIWTSRRTSRWSAPCAFLAMTCALVAGCFQDSSAQRSTFLPFDYQTSFLNVRACRLVAAHDNAYQIVYVNGTAADPYTTASYPLPAGSVVVAEQHQDPSCNSLNGYYLMAKESPGYDKASDDWHWQKLDNNQRVQQDGHLTACSSCHAKAPCTDFLCSPP